MLRTLMISVTAVFLAAGVWTVNLVCYHPVEAGLNPLNPLSTTAAWKE